MQNENFLNFRYAEQKRALMHAGEICQIAAHREFLIVNDTAPPIKAAYPPLAVMPQKFAAPVYTAPLVLYLGDIDARYLKDNSSGEKIEVASAAAKTEKNSVAESQESAEVKTDAVCEAVDDVLTEETVFGDEKKNQTSEVVAAPLAPNEDVASRAAVAQANSSMLACIAPQPAVLTKRIEPATEKSPTAVAASSGASIKNALNDLNEDVQARFRAEYESSLARMNRSVV